ncbi:hypothetical protein BO78DRAFT_110798 [Aspergillus sclerotiicarbonarius CBS 121057]|uniref:Uncharacterized protein n=1 Tax=Aspergillus sclerotiicarbonarius (strain CBS 121057 / IBT 28362) TaxID=1448318 RepID=A0A319EGE2_ASPSB|nr:hypothetical protein BO78DRAFT_110798 [Aspergillus sclerotiicarbonarius CBS 121057]
MALHRSGSYLLLSFLLAFFFPSIAACRHSVTFFSSFSSLLLLISPLFSFSFFFFYSPIFSHLWRHLFSPQASSFSSPPFPRSVLIFIPFPIVSRSSPLLSSLQLHDPSKFKYLATSYHKVASMVPTVRGGSRVLSVIANPVSTAFPWHILVSLSACVYVSASFSPSPCLAAWACSEWISVGEGS